MAEGGLSPEEAARQAETPQGLHSLYQQHIAVEDTRLFPLAARVLDAAKIQAVGREMAAPGHRPGHAAGFGTALPDQAKLASGLTVRT